MTQTKQGACLWRGAGPQSGFSLIEMAVVLALIGIMTTIAAIYVSSNETALRQTVLNFRFDLERAKLEALTRNSTVWVASSITSPSLDCNGDSVVDDKDRCYIIYQDLDDNGQYTAGVDPTEAIKIEMVDPSLSLVNVEGSGDMWFSPLGQSQNRKIEIQTAVPTDSEICSDRCVLQAYPFSISAVGRIGVGDKSETRVSCSYCDSCGDCL